MNALRARAPNSPKTPSVPRRDAAPAPSFAPAETEPAETESRTPAVMPSTSRLSDKVRGLVKRHPEETLSVLRRWMVEKIRGG